MAPKLSPLPDSIFDSIALSFSGGGFRASSFALGTLSLFHTITLEDGTTPLLHKVKYMSSASGGTIATGLYALYSAEDKKFGEFYAKLFNQTCDDGLLREALKILTTSSCWDSYPHKSRNMINAFALAYDNLLFKDDKGKHATLGSLKVNNTKTHLEEVCFNTTEFYHGLLFRQVVEMKHEDDKPTSRILYGNFAMHLKQGTSEHIKLSDALAASSCFPGGFEPMVFPDDFVYSKDPSAADYLSDLTMLLENGETEKPRVGFMDGGITDNLGLESMMQADSRDAKPHRFDLMITNDVGSHFISPYEATTPSKLWIGRLPLLFWLVVLMGVIAGSTVGAYHYYCAAASVFHLALVMFFSFAASLSLLGIVAAVLLGVAFNINFRKKFGGKIVNLFIKGLVQTPVNSLVWMVRERISSVSILVSDLFLKRVRQLLNNDFYSNTDWSGRTKGNRVYDLSAKNATYRKQNGFKDLEPTAAMQRVADISFAMPTTLWFDHEKDAALKSHACLIACGQFTTCYNLLDYIRRLVACPEYVRLPAVYRQRAAYIEKEAADLYAKLQADPFHLYNEIGRATITGFTAMSMADIKDKPITDSDTGGTPI